MKEKEKKKGGAGKFFGGIFVGLILAVLVVVLLMYLGILGFGDGTGKGDGDATTEQTVEEQTEEEKVQTSVEIEVKQDKYLVDGEEVSLDAIEGMVTGEDKEVTVYLVNNYASTKAWDDLQKLLTDAGIVPVE